MSVGSQVGAYRIIDQLGEGGMGTVWLAEHMTIGRRAAVKTLHGEYSTRTEIVQRFFNEARAATQINDPGIVQIFDFGTTPEGRAYIVMELLDGEPLDRRLQRAGKLTVHDALRIMRQVASTLGAAHARGIVHRDLKPENIFMVRDPEVPGGERAKILDFGIAKLSDNAGVKTQTNALMGTPQYMSPEQCRGSGRVDARSDVYALGCVMCTLITGHPPFNADGHGELIVMHLQQPAPLLSSRTPHVPAGVDAVAAKCLAKDPGERYATGTELAQAIGMLITSTSQAGAGASASLPGYQQMTVMAPQGATTLSGAAAQAQATVAARTKSKTPLLAIGTVVLLATGGGIAFLATRGGSKQVEPTAQNAAASTAPTKPEPAPPVPATPEPAKPERSAPPQQPPAAAPPPPAPPPEAAKPATVAITIASNPEAANVYVGGEKKPRGKTPYTLELERGSAAVEIKLERHGYMAKKTRVAPTEDTRLVLELDRIRRVTTTSDSDGTLNPFEKKR